MRPYCRASFSVRTGTDIQMMHDQHPQTTSTFDYVVVGTGAAGSIVAARLSESPGMTICALKVSVHTTGTHIFTFQRASSKSCSMKPTLGSSRLSRRRTSTDARSSRRSAAPSADRVDQRHDHQPRSG